MDVEQDLKKYRKLKNQQYEAMKRKHYSFALSMNNKLNSLSKRIDRNTCFTGMMRWRD